MQRHSHYTWTPLVFPANQHIDAPDPLPLNQWVHLAATLKSNVGTIYVNGVAVVSGTVTAPSGTDTRNNNYIGRSAWGSHTYANALFEDLRVWNIARTPAQLRQFMIEPVNPSDPNLLLNYRFDEPLGATAVDSRSTSPKNGTLTNGASRLPALPVSDTLGSLDPGTVYYFRSVAQAPDDRTLGKPERFATLAPGGGTALVFDGVDDHVAVASGVNLTNSSFTLEAWAQRRTSGTWDLIVGQGVRSVNQALNFGFGDDNRFWLGFHGNDLTTTAPYTDTDWHHWAATYDAATRLRCLYWDGTLVASNTATADYIGTGPLRIGGFPNGEFPFNGQIDEVRIWNVARSETQILADIMKRLTDTETNLVAYYRMDEGAGPVLRDATINARDGLLVNGPLRVPSPLLNESGAAPLRQAIADAAPGATISVTNTGTITLGWVPLVINKNLNLVGPGAANLAISGNNNSRVFYIPNGVTVNISGLTIRDGKSADGGAGAAGEPAGGIYNAGTLTLSNCVVTSNRAGNGGNGNEGDPGATGGAGGNGGGIFNASSGLLTLNRCTISDNSTGTGGKGGDGISDSSGEDAGKGGDGGLGAGICSDGFLTASNCTISGNLAGHGGDGGTGGVDLLFPGQGGDGGRGGSGAGIHGNGQVTLTACTLSANQSGAGGNGNSGGSHLGVPLGVPGNGGDGGSGGGICNSNSLTVLSCTIAENSAGPCGTGGSGFYAGSPGEVGRGGGITSQASAQSMQLVNTIVALNNRPTNAVDDVAGAFFSLGHNLIGSTNGSTGFGASGDQLNVDPLLWPISDYGGPTLTYALPPYSPAIDAGDDGYCSGTDQRGVPRPWEGNGDAITNCDIGPYEAQFGYPILLAVPGTDTADRQTATLDGWINPNGESALVWFEWGTNSAYGHTTASILVDSGVSNVLVSAPMIGLPPGTTYQVRMVASNRFGVFYSRDAVFESVVTDRANWMSNRLDRLGSRALKDLVLPASHDAAMYMADLDNTQFTAQWNLVIQSCDYEWGVWSINQTPAAFRAQLLDVADAACDWIPRWKLDDELPSVASLKEQARPKAKAYALTQDRTILEQLDCGVRYFDLRPKLQDGTWFIHHSEDGLQISDKPHRDLYITFTEFSVNGPRLDTVLNDVRSFITNHQELAVLKFSHYMKKNTGQPNLGFVDTNYLQFITQVTNRLGPWLYTNSLPPGKRLADVTLGEFLADHGTVLVVCDEGYPTDNPTPGIWGYEDYYYTTASSSALRVYDVYSHTNVFDAMKADQLAKFQSYGTAANGTDTCDLFLLSWTLTGDGSTSISDMAALANPYLADEMAALPIPNSQGRIPNLLYVDFVETARVTDVAVYLNTAPSRPTLRARWMANQFELQVESVPGLLLQIEQTTDLANPVWTPVGQPVTITNAPHVLMLPLPAGPTAFWRAVLR